MAKDVADIGSKTSQVGSLKNISIAGNGGSKIWLVKKHIHHELYSPTGNAHEQIMLF